MTVHARVPRRHCRQRTAGICCITCGRRLSGSSATSTATDSNSASSADWMGTSQIDAVSDSGSDTTTATSTNSSSQSQTWNVITGNYTQSASDSYFASDTVLGSDLLSDLLAGADNSSSSGSASQSGSDSSSVSGNELTGSFTQVISSLSLFNNLTNQSDTRSRGTLTVSETASDSVNGSSSPTETITGNNDSGSFTVTTSGGGTATEVLSDTNQGIAQTNTVTSTQSAGGTETGNDSLADRVAHLKGIGHGEHTDLSTSKRHLDDFGR